MSVPESDTPVPPPTSLEIQEKFKKIVKDNGIEDEVAEVIMKDAGLKGEGFASITSLIMVHFKDALKKPLNLFIKTETSNPSHSQFLQEAKLFEKEGTFFTGYVPETRQLLVRLGHEHLLDIYPKCYYADSKMIVMENLVLDKGFQLLDKTKKQDFNAACMALSSLAKHHAISHAVIKNSGGHAAFFKKFPCLKFEPFNIFKGMMEPMMENGIKTIIEILQRSSENEKEEAIAILEQSQGKTWDLVQNGLKFYPEDGLHLLCHGDFWSNNNL